MRPRDRREVAIETNDLHPGNRAGTTQDAPEPQRRVVETATAPADRVDRVDRVEERADAINAASAGHPPTEDVAVTEEEGTTIANAKARSLEMSPHHNVNLCALIRRNLRSR
jgi:hypothetical protein